MAKKYIHKALSVGLSLALCAGLVLPSFAASMQELKDVINNQTSLKNDSGEDRISYDNGTVKLYEDVASSKVGESGIHLDGSDKNIVLDLNGHGVQGAGDKANDAVIVLKNGAQLTLQDSSEGKTGQIISGTWGGVSVESGSTFTMEDGTITNNAAFEKGAESNHSASGVTVSGGNFIMNGGEISNNKGNTAAVIVKNADDKVGNFEMHGGTIDAGDRVAVDVKQGSFTMDGEEAVLKSTNNTVNVADGAQATVISGRVSSLDEHYLGEHSTLGAANSDGLRTVVYNPPAEEDPTTPITPTTPDAPVIDETVEIDDPAVPLAAGPVTRGEFIDYLWRHEGEPEAAAPTYTDVSADYEYAPAIGWAQSIGILDRVVSENSFAPDELVTVAVVRDILADFAQYAGMEMPELTTLAGEDDEAVLNCDEILAEFFGEELAA